MGRILFSPDGQRVVTFGQDLRLWDAVTGEELLTLGSPIAGDMQFSADGRQLINVRRGIGPRSHEAIMRVWDARPLP